MSTPEVIVDAEIVEQPADPAEASVALVPVAPSASTQLIQAASAADRVLQATEMATQLDAVIKAQGMRTKVGRRQVEKPDGSMVWGDSWHVNVEGWQTLATFLGIAPVPVWTRQVMDPTTGKPERVSFEVVEKSFHKKADGGGLKAERTYTVEGYNYEARVEIFKDGALIGAGESMCSRTEKRWKDADDFALRSMAQTRATSRAIGASARWIVTLAGYSGTPAEEMDAKQSAQVAPLFGPAASDVLGDKACKAIGYLLGDEPDGEHTRAFLSLLKLTCKNNGAEAYYPRIVLLSIGLLAGAVKNRKTLATPGEDDPAGETPEEKDERERAERLAEGAAA